VLAANEQHKDLIESAHSRHYGVLPMFPERRLSAQADLFDFCRKNKVNYIPDEKLEDRLDSLEKCANFDKLYRLENELISSLKLTDVTAVEYWCSIGGEKEPYSIGRILDKFYSLHFKEVMENEQELRLYLKKAYAYDQFGIIGTCNKYLWKFGNCNPSQCEQIKKLKENETDPDIITEIDSLLKGKFFGSKCDGKIPRLYSDSIPVTDTLAKISRMSRKEQGKIYMDLQYNEYFMDWVENGHLEKEARRKMISALKKYAKSEKESDFEFDQSMGLALWLKKLDKPLPTQLTAAASKKNAKAGEEALEAVALSANYQSLPDLVNFFRNREEKSKMQYYLLPSHIKEDLAIPVNIADSVEVDTMLHRYKRFSEKEFYRSYLYDLGYRDLPDGSVNYLQLYDMLEFDVVDAFVGGGGGRRSESAFLAIRFLELQHGTRLGFHWRMTYIRAGFVRTEYERSCAWMKWLRDKGLVKLSEEHVPSFSN
jgi:hypothetical protein